MRKSNKVEFDHKQVQPVVNGRELPFTVDEKIAPVLLELWTRGIRTHCSCQDVDGFAYIALGHSCGASPPARSMRDLFRVAKYLSGFVNVYLDVGPSGMLLRFQTKHTKRIAKLLEEWK